MIKTLDSKYLSELDVLDWGYTEALTPASYELFLKWIEKGYEGSLKYLADERKSARSHLNNIFPNTQSILVFLFGYHKQKKHDLNHKQTIASYVTAFNDEDYHTYMRDRLVLIGDKLKDEMNCNYNLAIDTKPILERDFAYQAGLGWFGKNSMILNRESGSYFMIGVLLLDQKLDLNLKPFQVDHCGNCRACIDACPTNAILENERRLDAEKCISTYTIEHFKDLAPPKGYVENPYIFGCDICQDVCPWNKKSLKNISGSSSSSNINSKLQNNDLANWLESISNREFRRIFANTPLERTGRIGLLKNIKNKKITN